MASTAHKSASELVEYHDDPAVLDAKLAELAHIIKSARCVTVWTGAGVSTSCGIPDFRGPNGKWTLQAQNKKRDPSIKVVSSLSAHPSPTHMALVGLLQSGLLSHIISSNTDGLHRRSGVHPKSIAELHGNTNKMRCDKCGKFCLFDGRTRIAAKAHSHETDFKCPVAGCTGTMCDTIINFGEYLLDEVHSTACTFGAESDVLLVLGSSLRVITCDALDSIQQNHGKLIVVNLQTTPYDKACALRIFANCDDVMQPLLDKLGVPLPSWTLNRFAEVSYSAKDRELSFFGHDELGCPYAWSKKLELKGKIEETTNVNVATATLQTKGRFPTKLLLKVPQSMAAASLVIHTMELRREPKCILSLPPIASSDWKLQCQFFLDMATDVWNIRSN